MALAVLFSFITLAFAGIAVAAAFAGRWAITIAAGALAVWMSTLVTRRDEEKSAPTRILDGCRATTTQGFSGWSFGARKQGGPRPADPDVRAARQVRRRPARRGLPTHVDEGDLVSYGLLGLIGAIERYDPDRDVKFETYAIARIRGAIIDELRALDWVPRSVRSRAREIERAIAELEAKLGRAPTTRRSRRRSASPRTSSRESLTDISRSSIAALDELWSVSGEGDQVSLLDTIEDTTGPSPEAALDETEVREALAEAIARLPEREKLVITLYYYEELTLREIGEVLGVTESRVSQLHTKAILRLKARLAGAARAGRRPARASRAADAARGATVRFAATRRRQLEEEPSHAAFEPGKIRNVAVVGHRGTGKTSLVEAMLFQAGADNRLGTVEQGTTVSDWDEDEQRRQMSLAASLCHLEWQGRKINLIDTPGDAGFQADTVAALRVVEGALVVVNGVMGVEVHTARVWERAEELGLSRVVFVNMLDRERADFFRTLDALQEQLSDALRRDPAPDRRRARADGHRRPAPHLRLHDPGRAARGRAGRRSRPSIADAGRRVPREAARRRRRDRRGADGALSRGRGARRRRGRRRAQGRGHARRALPGRAAASRRRTSARRRCSTCSSRASRRRPEAARRSTSRRRDAAFVFKTVADPFAGRITVFRVSPARSRPTRRSSTRATTRRSGSACSWCSRARSTSSADGVRRGRHRRRREAEGRMTGDVLVDAEHDVEPPRARVPRAGDELRRDAEGEGRRGEGRARRSGASHEEDPTLRCAATRRRASSFSRA